MIGPACGQEERQGRSGREVGGARARQPMTPIMPASASVLARAAWILI
jgi:hypothetical protein